MIVMDACTTILLAKASLLETVLNEHQVQMTREAYDEIMEGKSKTFPDALLLERLHEENKIKKITADRKLAEKIVENFKVEIGEASTIAAAIKNKAIIASDDRQGRKAAKVNNLQLTGAIGITVSLFKKGKITHDEATEALNTLQREGWFEDHLIEKAKEELI